LRSAHHKLFKQVLTVLTKMSSSVRHLLLLSNSTLHPTGYLEYAKDHITKFLQSHNVKKVLFVPYALKDRDGYAETARKAYTGMGFELDSIHDQSLSPKEAVMSAQAIFIGGGNTFRLLKSLYDDDLVAAIRSRVLEDGMPYIGSSAGTNVATASICTTNDMPIVYPPTFHALQLVPFNINPHYLDHDPTSTHKGETREQRILQYHEEEEGGTVLALREGSILHVENKEAKLLGTFDARLFVKGQQPKEFPPETDFGFLL